MRDGALDWDALVPYVLHPVRVAIIEAMRWIDEPFSAKDLDRMYDRDSPGVPAISYHFRKLRLLRVLDLYREEMIKGTTRKLYFFRGHPPASRSRKSPA